MSQFDLSDSTYTAYTWTPHLYLSEKQCGIQSAHCISDMSLLNNEIYQKWAETHKTLIMFEGVNCGTVRRIHHILKYAQRNLARVGVDIPVVSFHEDEESLDGAITGAAMVFPDKLRQFSFDCSELTHDGNYPPLTTHYGDWPSEWDVTTRNYYEEILHSEHIASRAFIPSSGPNPDHEKFTLVEFSEWMRKQRLV